MPINILMPALSPTMAKGNLAKWLKKEGDTVKSGDVIAEIETDKATMEVEAIDEGVLAKILVPEGTADVPVNQLIALIAGEGEDPKSVSAAGGGAQRQRVFASPLARRIAKEAGIEIAMIQGSGPHGRVIERDVRTSIAGGGAKAPPTAATAAAPAAAKPPTPALAPAPSDAQVKALFEPGSYEEVPHDSMRRTIARRLTEARQTVPQFYLTMDCEIDALLKLREQVNAAAPKDKDGKPAWKVSVNDMAIKALA